MRTDVNTFKHVYTCQEMGFIGYTSIDRFPNCTFAEIAEMICLDTMCNDKTPVTCPRQRLSFCMFGLQGHKSVH